MSLYLDRLERNLYKLADIKTIKDAEIDLNNNNVEIGNIRRDDNDESIIHIFGKTQGERYYIRSHVAINTKKSQIVFNDCNCKYGYYSDEICKHVAAIILLYISESRREEKEEKILHDNMGVNLINYVKVFNAPKENIKLEVFMDKYKNSDAYDISFKIGQSRMYVLKNLKDFIYARLNNDDLEFGKGFTYSPSSQKFSKTDEEICRYIEEFVSVAMRSNYSDFIVKGKYMYISDIGLRKFLEINTGKEITLNDEKFTVLKEDIPIKFKLNKGNDKYMLKLDDKNVFCLTPRNDVYLFNGKIYLPSQNQIKTITPILQFISQYNTVEFKEENKADLFNNIVSRIESCGNEVVLDKKIDNIISEKLNVQFKLDYKKKKMVLDVDLKYGNEVVKFYNQSDIKEKIIIRDNNKEQDILNTLDELNFEYNNKQFVFEGNEEDLYNFIKEDYKKLEPFGDIYYSDRLKEKKVYINPKITAGINTSDNDYLEFKFQIEDINPAEYKNILEALNERRKYYKLKDDSFISLENEELGDFLRLVDNMDNKNKDGKINIGRNKAVVLNNYIKDKKLDFIEGTDIIEDISKKLYNLKKIKFKVPKNLNAELRKYQITGFNWFKNLSYLGFGGILADEMGLGKTIQTIAFLLSEKNKTTLIVAPTSLIYNWKNEFYKFAPSMKIGIVHGLKDERSEVLKNFKNYDVILTTYGTLRNDEEEYKSIKFDYCILDEGQNIKNPVAQNTTSVKNINAENRFVLTGTPIENNLIELWSIFDFLMPGYLDSVNTFKNKFVNKNDSVIELQKYIKPFMLRRLKKDVIKELPEKIEKNHYVELAKEQKKLYVSYVNDIKEKMESEEFKDDKITIFSYLTKLRQLCLDPSVIYDNYKGKNSKSDELISILHDYIEDNHKILVFSQFTSVLKNISNKLDEEKINHMYLDGSVNASKRLELVQEFNENKNIKVFLISLKAGGTGLNLTSADIVVHFDPWWNPAVEEQATDRAHRIGQKNIVQVIKLISEGTIEDKIINMQEEKKKLINDVIDSSYTSENVLKSLSSDELKSLFE
ncbi:serine/threonine protein phosphatase [Clostridium butyricum]|uniref:Serine/threonine protein phosphatase n=1 Tax=Clostridium butyricum TaxID=1492 RepID=A0A6L9ESZ2_CLOBU|nr:serine/threonine protein phosphatase [Clostridium butyricum]